MTSLQRTMLGIGMLAAGLILCLIAASIGWGGVQRWFAVTLERRLSILLSAPKWDTVSYSGR